MAYSRICFQRNRGGYFFNPYRINECKTEFNLSNTEYNETNIDSFIICGFY